MSWEFSARRQKIKKKQTYQFQAVLTEELNALKK